MDRSAVQEKLMGFLKEELLADQVSTAIQPDSPLIGGGDIDSLAVMRLVMFIESDLDVTVPLADLTPENFASIKVLSDYLEGRVVENRTG